MWSPRAEQIVSGLIAGLTPKQLDPARTHAVRLAALPIGGDMWADYYLRPNGEVVVVGEDLDEPEVDTVLTEESRVLRVLVRGAQRYPELRQLFPVREPGAIDCRCQQLPLFASGKVICDECFGLGWRPAPGS